MTYCVRIFYFKKSNRICKDEELYVGKDNKVYQFKYLPGVRQYAMTVRDDLHHDEEWYDQPENKQ